LHRPTVLIALVVLLPIAACGGDDPPPDPADAVRTAASAFVDALRGERWDEACGQMTAQAQAAVAEAGGRCAAALRAGAALPRDDLDTVARQLAGAPVRITGERAQLGPVGDLPEPLRFMRRGDRWLVAP
jgi:hypothetical protein